MAAFANTLGGVILIGTSKDDERLDYPGIPLDVAERLSEGFADAHARHLSPKPPTIERVIVPLPGTDRVMLAINVHAFSDSIVGAKVKQDIWVFPEREVSAWRFPVRVGVDTNFLEPAMLPLYSATVRRHVVLLGTIDQHNSNVEICFRNPSNKQTKEPLHWRITKFHVIMNRNVLVIHLEEAPAHEHRVPLDDIDCVWDSGTYESPRWRIRVLGMFGGDNPGSRRYHSNPSNATFA